jgi:hypothetical protein
LIWFLAGGFVSLLSWIWFPRRITEDVMVATHELSSKATNNERKYRSPNRVLARSFRLARDSWKQKYMDVRADLKSARQLATERGESRDRWRAECEAAKEQARAAETLAQERLLELEQLRARELDEKKMFLTPAS